MVIESDRAEAVARLLFANQIDRLRRTRFTGISLGAVVRLATVKTAADLPIAGCRWLDELSEACPAFAVASSPDFCGDSSKYHFGPTWSIAAWPSGAIPGQECWEPWEIQFRETVRTVGGSDVRLSFALCGAIGELIDNIRQHSSPDGAPPASGHAAYHVGRGGVVFTAFDFGVGALASLRRNPDWRHLTNDNEALAAILKERASRRIGLGPGEGYRTLLEALVNREAAVRLGSGTGRVQWISVNSRHNLLIQSQLRREGFSVEVECRWGPKGRIPIFNLTSSYE